MRLNHLEYKDINGQRYYRDYAKTSETRSGVMIKVFELKSMIKSLQSYRVWLIKNKKDEC